MDNTFDIYTQRMEDITKYKLQMVNIKLTEFLSVFPHNEMDIAKEKASKAAYQASCVVWDRYPPVTSAIKDIENTLYLACNDTFIESLCYEVAQLQTALEGLLAAYNSVKSNPNMAKYANTNIPFVLKKPKEVLSYLINDLTSMSFIGKMETKQIVDLYKEQQNKLLLTLNK